MNYQKQPPRGVPRKRCAEKCSKFTGEHQCRSAISIKLQNNFIEITLRHGCSPVNLLHIFRTPFLKNTSGWLLVNYLLSRRRLIESCCWEHKIGRLNGHLCLLTWILTDINIIFTHKMNSAPLSYNWYSIKYITKFKQKTQFVVNYAVISRIYVWHLLLGHN